MKEFSRSERILAAAGLAEGVLLGWGLEVCFGVGRYRLIMALGILGGLGAAIVGKMAWSAWERAGSDRAARLRSVLVGAVPAAVAFGAWFLWRVLPLIREEMKYSL